MKNEVLRMQTTVFLLAGVCFLALAACEAGDGDVNVEPQPETVVDTAAEAEAIMALEREWSSKFQEGDIDWIMSLHAANARQLPPGAGPVVGADALRAAWEGMINTEGLELSWEPAEAHVSHSGDMAYDYGTAMLTTPDGKSQAMKYLVVWVRENGEWKIAADMFNSNGTPESSPS